MNEVLDSGRSGQRPFGVDLLGTRLSLSGTEVSWEVVGLLDEVPGWFWLSRGELESVLPTVLAPASSVAGVDREDVGYGMTTLYVTADDSSAAAADVERLLEEDPALALGAWLCAQGGLTVRSLGLEVPWAHVAGAVALVALALLASCAHALRRLRAAPLIDALRSE